MTQPLERSMKKLHTLHVQGYLEEVVFGPDDNAIFMFHNGSFVWDLPLESEEHELLQRCYSMGIQLEAAALSLVSPGDYFFFWGHCNASYRMTKANHDKADDMMKDCCMTRMHHRMLQSLITSCDVPVDQTPSPKMSYSPSSVLTRTSEDNVSNSNASSETASIDAETEGRLQIAHQLSGLTVYGPRQGNGNLRTWPDVANGI